MSTYREKNVRKVQCFFRVCGQTLVTSSSTHFGHALIGAVLSVSPSIFLHLTISAVDSNLVLHDNKQAATGVEWLRQGKRKGYRPQTGLLFFASWHRLLSVFVVWLCICLKK